MHSTRSGTIYSPFYPILVPDFDLNEAVRRSLELQNYEDDPGLTSPPLDHNATLFWNSVATTANATDPVAKTTIRDDALSSSRVDAKHPLPSDNCAAFQSTEYDSAQSSFEPLGHTSRNRKNARVHAKRAKRQAAEAKKHGLGHHPPRPEVIATHVTQSIPIETDFTSNTLPHESSGFTANTRCPSSGEGHYVKSLEDLLAEGYKLIEWDGVKGRIFAVLVGQPDSKTGYDATSRLAYEAIMQEGRNAKFTDAEMHHCRGDFPALNVGVTMGLGATYPTNLNSEGPHAKMLDCLLENEHIQRMAHFADGAFNLLAPNLYKHYHDHLKPLFDDLPYLRRIFPKSVFTAAAFNFGGNVSTKVHRDCMNYAVGWCAIQALGLFDPKNSGHIVLTDLKLIIEFPPGALILIPSATLAHGNLPVAQGKVGYHSRNIVQAGSFVMLSMDFVPKQSYRRGIRRNMQIL
ncbi:hypothetical protein C0992_002339 [Termitomyces sp. T32_za158]|nr:hypothetical protein C0992_002339 [Termitomyces sp. T32_za158]